MRPLVSYTLLPVHGDRPALTGGLFFDALGGGREAVFLSASKNLRQWVGVPGSVYLGGAKISNEDHPRFIGGGSIALIRGVAASLQYDGKTPHLGLTGHVGSVGGTPIYVGMILTGGTALGPIAAADYHLAR